MKLDRRLKVTLAVVIPGTLFELVAVYMGVSRWILILPLVWWIIIGIYFRRVIRK